MSRRLLLLLSLLVVVPNFVLRSHRMLAGSPPALETAKKAGPLAGGLQALPPDQVLGRNDVANSSFESGDSGWTLPRCWKIDDSAGHDGLKSLRFESGFFCPTARAQTLVDRSNRSARSYTLRAWVKTSEGSNLQVRLALHDPKDRDYLVGATKDFTPGPTWQLIEKKDIDILAIHDGHPLAVATVVRGSSGQAWFDDVQLIEQDPPPLSIFILYPNFRGFVWADGPQRIQLRADIAVPELKGVSLHVLLKDEMGRTVKAIELAAQTSQLVEFDTSRLAPGSYSIDAKLVDGRRGQDLAAYPEFRISKTTEAFRSQLVNYIAPDNFLVREGKKRFVWGVYDRFSARFRCRDCLFTTAEAYNSIPGFDGKSTLDSYADTSLNAEINILPFVGVDLSRHDLAPWLTALHSRGVGHLQIVNTWVNGSRGYPNWARSMSDEQLWRELASTMTGKPGALGYYTYDEPTTDKIATVFAQYKVLREADPGSVTYGVLANCAQLYRWRDSSDVVGCDPYPVGFEPNADDIAFGATSGPVMIRTSTLTREVVRQVQNSRPVWMVLQLFRFNGRFPTYEQMKMQAYKSIINGATGILWWGFVSEKGMEAEWYRDNNHQSYEDFRRISHEVMSLEPLLVSAPRPELLASVSDQRIETLVKADGEKLVVFASNFTETPAGHVTFSLGSSLKIEAQSAEVYSENRTIPLGVQGGNLGASMTDGFGPYEVHVYVVHLKKG